jgi:small subunit ribosomal protein S16
MLAIRMQRTGRKGHAMFRVIVQEARLTPTSGKVVALLGSYDPHAKTTTLDKEKAATFLKNGAQPSDRVALLLKNEGVKLPKWVSIDTKKAGKLKNPEKLRKNQPKEAPAAQATPAEEPAAVVKEAEASAPEATEKA